MRGSAPGFKNTGGNEGGRLEVRHQARSQMLKNILAHYGTRLTGPTPKYRKKVHKGQNKCRQKRRLHGFCLNSKKECQIRALKEEKRVRGLQPRFNRGGQIILKERGSSAE